MCLLLVALLYQIFLLFSTPTTPLNEFLLTPGTTNPIHHIKHLLAAQSPEEHYAFLSCLECIDPEFWAGTAPSDAPSILDEWEVERMMGFVDSSDALIRKKVGTFQSSTNFSVED